MAAPYLDAPESPRAGFRVIRNEDAVPYDGQAQAKREPFVMLTWSVYDRLSGDGDALAVLMALMRFADRDGVCWPKVALICEATGKSDRHVRDKINRLVELEIIVKERRLAGGMKSVNVYRICQKSPEDQSGTTNRTSGTECRAVRHGVPVSPAPGAAKQEPVQPEPIEPESPTGDTPPSPPVRSDPKPKRQSKTTEPTPEFLSRFWSRYPRNGRGNRGESFELWGAMSPDDQAAAIASLPLFAACSDWQRGYSPGAQVWLRNRRWLDPPADEVPTNGAVAPVVPFRSDDGLTVITGSKLDGVFNELRRERAEREGRVTADGAVIEARWTEGER